MPVTTLNAPPVLTETEYLSFLLNFAFSNNFSIAVWRLPNTTEKHLVVSEHHQTLQPDVTLEDLGAGFIFAPFDTTKERIFLPAERYFIFADDALKAPETPEQTNAIDWLHEAMKNHSQQEQAKPYMARAVDTTCAKEHYTSLVEKCLAELEKGTFEKVVPSRSKAVPLPANFDIISAFHRLAHAYSHALISFVSTPETGSWLGATPELLVSVENNTTFKTVALAGTQPFTGDVNLKTVAWRQKEIEEQALVERYIISCFKKIRLREYDEYGPKTVVAGNLMHLRSDFTVDMKETNFPQLGSVMLELLHPTSAVCGMPVEAAREFLRTHEGYDRAFYAGYLGPVNVAGNINIFVNLRCMQLLNDQAIVYAGAGVTIDSIPEDEWSETEMKFNTVLKAMA